MTKRNKVEAVMTFMDEIFPNVGCELKYNKDYELAIAVMLSAQTTDISVNKVTEVLFSRYSNIDDLASANIKDIEEIIHSIGLYKNKAKNVLAIANSLKNDFNYVLPSDKETLQKMPGIGNKTAGVIRAEIFKIPDLPVDTHILRISKRLKFVPENSDATSTEKELKKLFPEDRWIKTHHQLIHFGRYMCTARNPQCEKCKLCGICTKK